jgi:hypothetical protein
MRSITRSLLSLPLFAWAMHGCSADLQRYVVQGDLPALDGAKVTSVRLVNGTAVKFDTTRGRVSTAGTGAISGRTVVGDSIDVPFAQVAEADATVSSPSTAGTWLVACATVAGAFVAFIAVLAASWSH